MCTNTVDYSTQTDNGTSVDGPLYTGVIIKGSALILSSFSNISLEFQFTLTVLKYLCVNKCLNIGPHYWLF